MHWIDNSNSPTRFKSNKWKDYIYKDNDSINYIICDRWLTHGDTGIRDSIFMVTVTRGIFQINILKLNVINFSFHLSVVSWLAATLDMRWCIASLVALEVCRVSCLHSVTSVWSQFRRFIKESPIDRDLVYSFT